MPIPGRLLFPNEVPEFRAAPRPGEWDDFWYANESYESSAGVDVNEDNALTFATVWACVRVIAEDLGSIPLIVYRKDGDNRTRAEENEAYYILHDAPNKEMSSMQFRETMQAHVLLWGNAYAQIEWSRAGKLKGLWPLHPGRMTVIRQGAELAYEYRIDGGSPIILGGDEVLHLRGLSFNGISGLSPIGYHREAVGVGLAAQEYQGSNYKSGNRLQLAFIHPSPVPPEKPGRDALRKELASQYTGKNASKIGVLFENMKPETIGMTLEDAQFIESRKFTRTEICGIFRVPPQKVMDLDRATFSNVESLAISYVVDTIRPWAVRWEQEVNRKLLGPAFMAEHLLDGLMRGDLKSRYDAYAVGRNWGWLSANDIRRRENENLIENGDRYLEPTNMMEAGAEPPAPQPSADPAIDPAIDQQNSNVRKIRGI